ncbi:MAG: DUF1573 domain-containing protein [Saprospiraceae bacterium]
MKKVLAMFCFLGMFSMANAQETAPAVPANPNGPKMNFEKMTMDYGTIEQDSDPLRKFMFTNTGKEPLIVSNAKGSCGCTVPDYPKKPILPGEKASIDVRYDTHRVGPFTKTVTLTTNTAEQSIVLTIKGDVKAKPVEESVPASTKSVFN